MKIKNLKYILGYVIVSLIVLNGVVFGAGAPDSCSAHPTGGTAPMPLGNDASSGYCWSFESNQNSPSWYNNNLALDVEPSFRHWLYDVGSFWHLENGCSYSSVADIQTLMQQIGGDCAVCIDGKAGEVTRSRINNCMDELCKASEDEVKPDGEGHCPTNYTLTESRQIGDLGYKCCRPSLSFESMRIIKQQWSNGVLSVSISGKLDHGKSKHDHYAKDTSKVVATNAHGDTLQISMSGDIYFHTSTNNYDIIQDINIQAPTEYSVTVNVASGFFTITNDKYYDYIVKSLQKSETFPSDTQQCDKPKDGNTGCNITYGPSYTASGSCCVTDCAVPQKTGGLCNNPSHIVDSSGCCVDNPCQYPPITGTTDCSNQFGGKGEYSGAISCCVQGTACAHPKNGSGLCDSPYVFDNNGECCIPCANPVDSSGNCQNGFTPQGGCCLDNGNCQNGYYDENTQCQQCTGDTVPNADRTRCICDSSKKCCGIQLNTVVPFIGDCIEMNTDSGRSDTTSVTSVTAFPVLMQGLMKILMSAIMVFSFLMVIVAGLSMTTGAFGGSGFTKGKTILKNVIISLILLGCSGLILSLINPNFFGG